MMTLRAILVVSVSLLCLLTNNMMAADKDASAAGSSAFETVATLPSAGATEGLCETADGFFYVTGIDDQVLWKITPNGKVDKFAVVPAHIMVPLVTKRGFVATARRNTAPRVTLPNGSIRL